MNINDKINALYDKCSTAEELRAEIAKIMDADGTPGEKWVNLTVRGLFGGTTAWTTPDGEYANKWRRKFQSRIGAEQHEKLAA